MFARLLLTRHVRNLSLALASIVVFAPIATYGQGDQQYYDPIAIATVRRQITQIESQVKALESVIADRRRQLDEAPAIVRPVQAQQAEAEAKYDASRIAITRINGAVREADAGLRDLKRKLEASIEQKPEYKAAQAAMEKAKANADRLRTVADERLQEESEYRRLAQTEALYQSRLDTVKEKQQSGEASPNDYLIAIKEFEAAQSKRDDYLEDQLKQDPAYQHANKLYLAANAELEAVRDRLTEKALADPIIVEFEKTIAVVKAQQREAIKFTTAAKKDVFAINAKLSRMKRQADAFVAGLNKVIRDRDVLDRRVNTLVARLRYLQSLPPRPIGQ